MNFKTRAVVILLLLGLCLAARAAEADYRAFAGGIDAQLELRPVPLAPHAGSALCAPAPAARWRPLLRLRTLAPDYCAGLFAQAAPGRLTLLIATPRSSRATLIELRLNLRPLLAWLRSASLLTNCVTTAARED